MLKASQLVKFCLDMVGMPYWYGTCVYNCTSSLKKRKAAQYPSHYGSSRSSRYNSDISKKLVCMDCVGMIKGFFWTNGGVGVREAIGSGSTISSKYGGNGCPDKGANGMLTWCKTKGAKNGKISSLPDVPGVLLFSPGHVGVYIGDGYAVEARGFNYGVVKTKVSARSWTSWAYMPDSILEYDTANSYPPSAEDMSGANQNDNSAQTTPPATKPAQKYMLGDRTIKHGTKGDDVAELQRELVKLGYNLGTYGANKDGVDGNCGAKTVQSIKNFQAVHGLEVDGKYGKKSHAAMQKVLNGISGNSAASEFTIKVNSWSVNIRSAPNTQNGKVVRVVRMNTLLTAVDVDPATGWYKLSDGNYISNKYTCKV